MVYRDKRDVSVSNKKDVNFNDVRILDSIKLADQMVKTLRSQRNPEAWTGELDGSMPGNQPG
jgi:hypothetical protein